VQVSLLIAKSSGENRLTSSLIICSRILHGIVKKYL